jgi:hypothetical protein
VSFVLDETTSTKTVMTLTKAQWEKERAKADLVHVVRFAETAGVDD